MEKTNEVEVEFQIKSFKNVRDDLLLITCRKLDLPSSMAANSNYFPKTKLGERRRTKGQLVLKGCLRKLNFSTFYWGKK